MPRGDSQKCLHTALRLARQNRWVSDWLFTTPHTFFHADVILPPLSLNAAIAWRIRKTFAPHLLDATEMRTEFDCMLMPVAYVNGIVVGYTLGAATDQRVVKFDFMVRDNPFDVPFKGRFAYDTSVKEALYVVQKRADKPVGVHFSRVEGGGLDHCTFVLPCGEYAFDKLPEEFLVMAYAPEYRIDGMDEGGMKECDAASLAVADRLIPAVKGNERLDELRGVEEGGRSYLPWIVGRGGLADGGDVRLFPEQMETSSGAFCYERLWRCLRALATFGSGRFYVPTARMDVLQEGVGACSLYTGRGFDYVRRLEGGGVERLKQLFAASYFVAVLGVAVDRRLLGRDLGEGGDVCGLDLNSADSRFGVGEAEGREVERGDGGEGRSGLDARLQTAGQDLERSGHALRRDGEGKRSTLRGAAPIAPARNSIVAEEGTVAVKESKAERQARLAYDRRRRNRLSAARSNARKKDMFEGMKKEIGKNWETVRRLEGKKEALMNENERLREMVGLMGAGG